MIGEEEFTVAVFSPSVLYVLLFFLNISNLMSERDDESAMKRIVRK